MLYYHRIEVTEGIDVSKTSVIFFTIVFLYIKALSVVYKC